MPHLLCWADSSDARRKDEFIAAVDTNLSNRLLPQADEADTLPGKAREWHKTATVACSAKQQTQHRVLRDGGAEFKDTPDVPANAEDIFTKFFLYPYL